MVKRVCDICGEPVEHQFKIKKLVTDFDYEGWTKKHWVELDICDKCYDAIQKIRYEKSLEDRLDKVISGVEDYNTVDLQTAYLSGVQNCYDVLLHNKIQKGKIR